MKKKTAAVTCVGLAFTNSTTLVLVLRNDFSVKPFPSDDWATWIKKQSKRPVVAIVEETENFEAALASGAQHVIALAKLDWLTNRGVLCLDAEEIDGLPVVKKLSPEKLMIALRESVAYQQSTNDIWLKRGDPAGKCSGCTLLEEKPCKGKKHPESPRCEKFTKGQTLVASHFSLCQLIHLALKNINEDSLMISPKEAWQMTFDYAIGAMPKGEWIAQCGRKLRTAGTNKQKLKLIVEWVNTNGKALAAGKAKNPPCKKDIKLAQKRQAAKGV